jgi:hypothetical protein
MDLAWISARRERCIAVTLARLGCGLGLASLVVALVWPGVTVAEVSQSGELAMSASGGIAPITLPRSKAAPASLRLGFTSEALDSAATPELSRIVLELGPNVELQTAGLASCSFAELYSQSADPDRSCAKSLVGHGFVNSEITLPGTPPTQVKGRLSAFYVLREGERRILARVRTGAPLPLIYVIPFKITPGQGVFRTSLVVRRMRVIFGICLHPNCFSPYTLQGVYGHISKLELSLHRRFARNGESDSFLSSRCPVPGGGSEAAFPLVRVSLDYARGDSLASSVSRTCRVAAE